MAKQFLVRNGQLLLGGGTPDASALLKMDSTTEGILIPRMDETDRDAIATPAHALLIFNTDAAEFQWYDSAGPAWEPLGATNPNTILQNGNTFGTAITIGTNDDNDLQLETNGVVRFVIENNASSLHAPNATGANGAGVFFAAGSVTSGTGDGGDMSIYGGDAVADGTGGDIILNAGNGTTADGQISFLSGNTNIARMEGGALYMLASQDLRLMDSGANYVGLAAPTTVTATYTITLPEDAPGADTVLMYDGADYVWSANGNGDILQGGNSFAADMSIGTNDSNALIFRTNNVERMYVPFGPGLIAMDSDTTPHMNLTAGDGVTSNNVGGDMILTAGSPAGDGNAGIISLVGGSAAGAGNGGNIMLTPGSSVGGLAGTIRLLTDEWSMNDEQYRVRQAVVSTTDDTITTLQTIAIPEDTTVHVEARVVGRRTGGSAGSDGDSATYVVRARAKNIGGTVTLHDLYADESEDQGSWDAEFDVNSTNVRVRVTGEVDNNIAWTTTTITQQN